MATFIVKEYGNLHDVKSYQARIEKILKDNKITLSTEESQGLFAQDLLNIEKHPRLWAGSSRTGASPIALNNVPKIDVSTYDKLSSILENRLAAYPYFTRDKNMIEAKAHLNDAFVKLDELQQKEVLEFKEKLRIRTVEELLEELEKNTSAPPGLYPDYIQKIDTIAAPHREQLAAQYQSICNRLNLLVSEKFADTIYTRKDALRRTEQINKLRNDIKRFNHVFHATVQDSQGFMHAKEIDHLADQLSIVAKRELDYYYGHPRQLTTTDIRRKKARTASFAVGGVLATAAFICLFIPGGQIAAIILGGISAIALYPAFDTMAEVTINLWHNRTPTKAQVTELGITAVFLTTLVGGAHIFPAIGNLLVNKSALIANKLNVIGNLLGSKINDAFGGIFNTLGGVLGLGDLKKIGDQKQKEAHPPIKATTTKNLKNGIGPVAKLNEAQIFRVFEETKKLNKFKYQVPDVKDKMKHQVHTSDRHMHTIDESMFVHSHKELADLVSKYRALSNQATIQERLHVLHEILSSIKSLPHETSPIIKLKQRTLAEVSSLKQIKLHMEIHGENNPVVELDKTTSEQSEKP